MSVISFSSKVEVKGIALKTYQRERLDGNNDLSIDLKWLS